MFDASTIISKGNLFKKKRRRHLDDADAAIAPIVSIALLGVD